MLNTTEHQTRAAEMPEITPELAAYFNKHAGRMYEGLVFGGMVKETLPSGETHYEPLFLAPKDSVTRFRVVADAFTYTEKAVMKKDGEVVASTDHLRAEDIKYESGVFALPSKKQVERIRALVAQDKEERLQEAQAAFDAETPAPKEEAAPVKATSWLSRLMLKFGNSAQPQIVMAPPQRPIFEVVEGFAGLRITWQDYYATSMTQQASKKGSKELQDEMYLAQLGGLGGSWEPIEIEHVKTKGLDRGAVVSKKSLPHLQTFNVRLMAKPELANQLFKGFAKSLVL